MTQKNKELLLKDLCARLLYGVIVRYSYYFQGKKKYADATLLGFTNQGAHAIVSGSFGDIDVMIDSVLKSSNQELKPYLRPMSSMTEEERKEYYKLYDIALADGKLHIVNDYLNSIYLDYRGLIEKGLALEAPEGMYNIKD